MAYPDPSLSDMSIGQLLKIIRDEVQSATPAIPANIAALADSDSPLIYPPQSDTGEGLFYNTSTGKYEPQLVDAPNLAANIILASQLIAGDPNAARVEVGVNDNNDTGVRSFDASNTNTFNIDAQDGSVYVKGRLDWGTSSRLLSNDIAEIATQVATGFQTPARVQVATKTYNGFASSNDASGTLNISWGAPTGNGSLVLLVVVQRTSRGGGTNPTLPTVSGWTQVQTVTGTTTDGGKMRQTIFKIENATSRSGSEGIALTGTSNTRYLAARMYEYSGVGTVDVVATANSGTAVSTLGTTISTNASGVLTQAGEVLFAAFSAQDSILGTVGGGFSDAGNTVSSHSQTHPAGTVIDLDLLCAELVTTSTATETATAVVGGAVFWMAQLITFKAAAASGGVPAPASNVARLYSQNDAASDSTPHVATTSGKLNSIAMAPQGAGWRLDFNSQVLSIPSTVHDASSTLAVSISGLNTGDLVMWIGVDAGSAFIFSTDPVCTVPGQITLRYHNSDSVTSHALATQTHTFLIIHRS